MVKAAVDAPVVSAEAESEDFATDPIDAKIATLKTKDRAGTFIRRSRGGLYDLSDVSPLGRNVLVDSHVYGGLRKDGRCSVAPILSLRETPTSFVIQVVA